MASIARSCRRPPRKDCRRRKGGGREGCAERVGAVGMGEGEPVVAEEDGAVRGFVPLAAEDVLDGGEVVILEPKRRRRSSGRLFEGRRRSMSGHGHRGGDGVAEAVEGGGGGHGGSGGGVCSEKLSVCVGIGGWGC